MDSQRLSGAVKTMFLSATAKANTPVRAGVGVILRNDAGDVLLERRSDCDAWGLLGGKIEPGESVSAAAVREVREESGLELAIDFLLGIYSEPHGRVVVYPDNGDTVQIVDAVMVGRAVGGSLRISHESLELRFFNRSELEALLPEIVPPAARPLRDYLDGKSCVLA